MTDLEIHVDSEPPSGTVYPLPFRLLGRPQFLAPDEGAVHAFALRASGDEPRRRLARVREAFDVEFRFDGDEVPDGEIACSIEHRVGDGDGNGNGDTAVLRWEHEIDRPGIDHHDVEVTVRTDEPVALARRDGSATRIDGERRFVGSYEVRRPDTSHRPVAVLLDRARELADGRPYYPDLSEIQAATEDLEGRPEVERRDWAALYADGGE